MWRQTGGMWRHSGKNLNERLKLEPTPRYSDQFAAQTDCPLLWSICSTNRLPVIVLDLQHKSTTRYSVQLAAQIDYPLLCLTWSTKRPPTRHALFRSTCSTNRLPLFRSPCSTNRLPLFCSNCYTNRLIIVLIFQHNPTVRYCVHFAAQTDCPLLCSTCNTNWLPIIVYNTHYSSFISLHR
jgi:hypothetical protein